MKGKGRNRGEGGLTGERHEKVVRSHDGFGGKITKVKDA